MTLPPLRIEHVAVWVNDLERMRAFYVDVLGGTSNARYHNPKTGFFSYFIAFGSGARVELMQRPDVAARPDGRLAGYAHLSFSVSSKEAVDRAAESLRARGIAIVSGPRTTGDGYYETVFLDPEGNEIELTE